MTKIDDIAKTSAKSSFYLFIGNTSSHTITAVGSAIVARLLGPEDYGLYTLAMLVSTMFLHLCDLGISASSNKVYSEIQTRIPREKGGESYQNRNQLLGNLIPDPVVNSIPTLRDHRPRDP